MSYLKLKKQNGAFDLVPADSIVYVDGNESITSATDAGAAPFVDIAYAVGADSDILASRVILGNADSTTATTTAATTMQNAVNDAIVTAASQMEPVEVDFSGLLKDANYVPIVAGETFVKSAGPILYAVAIPS